ncbi:MAG: selenide, water dikinase SelD [Candidatus Brocadiia bacterium]
MEDLAQVLGGLPQFVHPDLLVGTNTIDDAAIYRIAADKAIVLTVDLFPPVIDDPFDYGYIVGANSLSDVWAMGGTPIAALNIISFPMGKLDGSVLSQILLGGSQAIKDASALIVGGHSWYDDKIAYGMAITGIVHPDKVVTTAGAKPGQTLILTKPLGCGTITNCVKPGWADADVIASAVSSMKKLNRRAGELMVEFGASACTDVTGFGLFGHLGNITKESGISAEIFSAQVPLVRGAFELAEKGYCTAMSFKNFKFLRDRIDISKALSPTLVDLLFDAETSGGLLIVIDPSRADGLLKQLIADGHTAAVIGTTSERSAREMYIR